MWHNEINQLQAKIKFYKFCNCLNVYGALLIPNADITIQQHAIQIFILVTGDCCPSAINLYAEICNILKILRIVHCADHMLYNNTLLNIEY